MICLFSIDCDPIRSPAPEMIYEEGRWIERLYLYPDFFFDWYCHLYIILGILRQIFLAADS